MLRCMRQDDILERRVPSARAPTSAFDLKPHLTIDVAALCGSCECPRAQAGSASTGSQTAAAQPNSKCEKFWDRMHDR